MEARVLILAFMIGMADDGSACTKTRSEDRQWLLAEDASTPTGIENARQEGKASKHSLAELKHGETKGGGVSGGIRKSHCLETSLEEMSFENYIEADAKPNRDELAAQPMMDDSAKAFFLRANNLARIKARSVAILKLVWSDKLEEFGKKKATCEQRPIIETYFKNEEVVGFSEIVQLVYSSEHGNPGFGNAVAQWLKGKEHYNYDFNMCTGTDELCDQYKQIVWSHTSSMACVMIYCPLGNRLFCFYGPGFEDGGHGRPFEAATVENEEGPKFGELCSQTFEGAMTDKCGLCVPLHNPHVFGGIADRAMMDYILTEHNNLRKYAYGTAIRRLEWSEELEAFATKMATCETQEPTFSRIQISDPINAPRFTHVGQLMGEEDNYFHAVYESLENWKTNKKHYNRKTGTCPPSINCDPYKQMVSAATGSIGCFLAYCSLNSLPLPHYALAGRESRPKTPLLSANLQINQNPQVKPGRPELTLHHVHGKHSVDSTDSQSFSPGLLSMGSSTGSSSSSLDTPPDMTPPRSPAKPPISFPQHGKKPSLQLSIVSASYENSPANSAVSLNSMLSSLVQRQRNRLFCYYGPAYGGGAPFTPAKYKKAAGRACSTTFPGTERDKKTGLCVPVIKKKVNIHNTHGNTVIKGETIEANPSAIQALVEGHNSIRQNAITSPAMESMKWNENLEDIVKKLGDCSFQPGFKRVETTDHKFSRVGQLVYAAREFEFSVHSALKQWSSNKYSYSPYKGKCYEGVSCDEYLQLVNAETRDFACVFVKCHCKLRLFCHYWPVYETDQVPYEPFGTFTPVSDSETSATDEEGYDTGPLLIGDLEPLSEEEKRKKKPMTMEDIWIILQKAKIANPNLQVPAINVQGSD